MDVQLKKEYADWFSQYTKEHKLPKRYTRFGSFSDIYGARGRCITGEGKG
jgi:hypothetical protein